MPLKLDVRKYLQLDEPASGGRGRTRGPRVDTEYELHGVVVHEGGLDEGHYYFFGRPNNGKDVWALCNDAAVSTCSTTDVLHVASGATTAADAPYSRNAYMLFYSRRNS